MTDEREARKLTPTELANKTVIDQLIQHGVGDEEGRLKMDQVIDPGSQSFAAFLINIQSSCMSGWKRGSSGMEKTVQQGDRARVEEVIRIVEALLDQIPEDQKVTDYDWVITGRRLDLDDQGRGGRPEREKSIVLRTPSELKDKYLMPVKQELQNK